ncbi:hypothetical protein CC1G_06949 [Coprinopsis cinerea okayama7|uniref:Yeast cell wall synthesis Kre9/Knh1-like N-terminal domain-containing protein n=1 Tax=Coprinopsis cinerea (strain Okayama-7 / 130 / ATCC MYA-4618 / FGSC 9003) TaxID=240176 RepID=A8NZT3_COPC7|nr:hypothetical protein CC1G_06949 [Coprinopsis cinerea okayama7\|eukprot:XP_001837743.1 hypothetical protein CC1G_06949 [Coprinopsis cinerea okayama7\
MESLLFTLVTFLLAFHGVTLVKAGLYVVEPFSGSTCHGGEPCTVTWLDDGRAPLLSAIGVVTVGLYTGDQQLVQRLKPVDVSAVRSLTFTPNPAAGPDSDAYYIAFTSVELMVNETGPYTSWSPWFRLDRMTGSFEEPLPSAVESIPVPSSLTTPRPSTTVLSTITVGAPSPTAPTTSDSFTSTPVPPSDPEPTPSPSPEEELPPPSPSSSSSSLPTSSGFITSRIPAPTTASSASEEASSAPSAGSARSSSTPASASSATEPAPTSDSIEESSAIFTTAPVRLSLLASLAVLLVF